MKITVKTEKTYDVKILEVTAAPDMFEALELLVRAKDIKKELGKTDEYEAIKSEAWEKARESLSKAKGGE